MMKGIAAGVLFLSITPAFGSTRVVIEEMRKLKSALPVNDPSRSEISLRLADRLADQALLSKDQAPSQAEADRLEAIQLYQENLSTRAGEAQIKIQFQLARLFAEKSSDPSSMKASKEWFEKVSTTTQSKELKRESFLRLAEFAENQSKNSSDASNYYRQALTLCEGTDSCSFSHYRLAWIERNQEHLATAIDEMKLALWDSKGQLREEAARDLVTFMGLVPTLADQNIAYIDQLATKVNRPTLLEDLAYAYLSTGHKDAGVKVLALTHSRAPSLYGQIRLMEEYYGLRQWDQFRATLNQFETSVNTLPAGSNLANLVEIEKIGRRLATQLDGERTTDPTRFEDFKKFTLTYLNLFPQSKDCAKIMEGLIAAEPVPAQKISQLKAWLQSGKFKISAEDEVRLRELRASIAQKQSEQDVQANTIVIEEMNALIAKGGAKTREYRYQSARAAYAMKNFVVAIPAFEALAASALTENANPDAFAVQSQHLLLDIHNQNKNFAQLLTQARLWTANPNLIKNSKISGDLKEMNEIAEQAGFESAMAKGETRESLDQFLDYCKNGKFLPKSCENAKVLAIRLNQHPKLISVLELQAKQDPKTNSSTLADEYENGGYFAQAATLIQNLNPNADFKTRFKMALLNEVARNEAAKNEVLKGIRQSVISRKVKLEAAEEKAILVFLNDADLLDASLLNVLAVNENKGFLAEQMEERNQGNPQTQKVLLGFDTYQGLAWSKRVVEKAEALAAEESKIKFHGRNGQVMFQKRVNRLKELNQFADRYLSGSDSLTRTKLLAVLKNSHEQISSEILGSPIPSNLNEEQIAQIQAGLAEMAKPFQEKVTSLQQLLDTESQKVSMTQSGAKGSFDEQGYQDAIVQLHQNPKNAAVLGRLKSIFEAAGFARPAAYFEGRIQGL